MSPIPITILTGFLGSGKTTILLNLIPQLPPTYRLALLKNEFGDLAIDSQLASTNSISGVRELLNGCICCNLVGQLGDALVQLKEDVKPDRIVIETSGSAFPATLAMEVNRVAREQDGAFLLDGVVSVIDVENWEGYDDTSYTAKLQARYTDLIIFNKWEGVGEERFEVCLDRMGDLEVETAWVRAVRGRVERDVLLGIDGALLAKEEHPLELQSNGNGADHGHGHGHEEGHQSEVEVLSISLTSSSSSPLPTINLPSLSSLLLSAPKDEVYRIKGILHCSTTSPPADSSGEKAPAPSPTSNSNSNPDSNSPTPPSQDYILNWAFGRWTFTPTAISTSEPNTNRIAQITMILARHESAKWRKKIEAGGLVEAEKAALKVERLV